MAEAVIDEALRNAVAVGGDPERTAILDNFSWGNCDKPERLGALVLGLAGCYRARSPSDAVHLGQGQPEQRVPRRRRADPIPPTLLVSALAVVPDVGALRRHGPEARRLAPLPRRPDARRARRLALPRHVGSSGGRVPRPTSASRRDSARAARRDRAGCVLAATTCRGRARRRRGRDGLRRRGSAPAAARAVACVGLANGFDPDSTRLYSEIVFPFPGRGREGTRGEFERALAGFPFAHVGEVAARSGFASRACAAGSLLDGRSNAARRPIRAFPA
jgi:hypothetical protein